MDLRARRAQNEAMSRMANEAIEQAEDGADGPTIEVLCECARLECDRLIEIDPDEYRRVRAHPRWFVVLPGHQSGDLESVVSAGNGYLLVEKQGAAGELAEAEHARG